MGQKALKRYELTWKRFVKELETDSKTTLRDVCKTMHTDYTLMKKWASGCGALYSRQRLHTASRYLKMYLYRTSPSWSRRIILLFIVNHFLQVSVLPSIVVPS